MPETVVAPSADFQERTRRAIDELKATFIHNKLAGDRRLSFDNAILTLTTGVCADETKPEKLGNWHPVSAINAREWAVDALIFTTDEPLPLEEKREYFYEATTALWHTATLDTDPVIAERALGALMENLGKIATSTDQDDHKRILAFYLSRMPLLDASRKGQGGFSDKIQIATMAIESQIAALPEPAAIKTSDNKVRYDGFGGLLQQNS